MAYSINGAISMTDVVNTYVGITDQKDVSVSLSKNKIL
jgi:hypothetical protein